MTDSKATPSYQQLSQELESIMLELESDDLDIDVALSHYKRGLAVVQQLESYLKSAENSVKKLQTKFKTDT